MKLSDYFLQSIEGIHYASPRTGLPSGWLDFCEFSLRGSSILVVDASFVPAADDGLLIELPPGKYEVQAQVLDYGGDRRPARLRVCLSEANATFGSQIGETWTDTATTGICDFEIFSAAWGEAKDAAFKMIQPALQDSYYHGVAVLNANVGAIMPFLHSGFGDGHYPVYELTAAGRRVGFEVEFIGAGKDYPFGETPSERNHRVQTLVRQAEAGDPEKQWQAGQMYRKGEGVIPDTAQAAHWYAQAAAGGHAEAAYALGALYEMGKGVPQDYARARELLEQAAGTGFAAALNRLGNLYHHGHGVPVDHVRAVQYYTAAAEKNSPAGQYNLANHYAQGLGLKKDDAAAAKWFRISAENGHAMAMFNLGVLYYHGLGVPQDDREAFKWFQAGAAKDHPESHYNVACCYETGRGVERSMKRAQYAFTVAANQGISLAQFKLGMLYKQGADDVPQDLEKSLNRFKKAAKGGHAEAHFELGDLYERGEGVPADRLAAARHFQAAAAKGVAPAAERLAILLPNLTDAERASLVASGQ